MPNETPTACRPTPILLMVSGLQRGGAERQVVQLANHLLPERWDVSVCTLSTDNPLAADLRNRERRLHIVEKHWRFDFGTIWRAAQLMRRLDIKLVHAFLFDAEMVARLAARLARVPVVIASERNSDYERPRLHTLCQKLTRNLYDVMIANSSAGKRFNVRTLGLPEERIHVVHNGVDTERFRPADGSEVRSALGIAAGEHVVGMVANVKPQKNWPMFLDVARRVLERLPNTRFVCVGAPLQPQGEKRGALKAGVGIHGDTQAYQRMVAARIDELGLRERLVLLGHTDDVARLYNAFDVLVLTSVREGTPNVLLEAMAAGVPVVATDVADNAYVVPDGRAGYIVPSGDARAMAARVCVLLTDAELRARAGAAARSWASSEFSLGALAARTELVYRSCLQRKRPVHNPDDAPLGVAGATAEAAARELELVETLRKC